MKKNFVVPNPEQIEYIIGIDFGHGETSAAITRIDSKYDPEDIEITEGKKAIPSVMRIDSEGKITLGDEAVHQYTREGGNFYAYFKQSPNTLDEQEIPNLHVMKLFMKSVYDELRNLTSSINELVFCVKMTVRQFCDLRDAIAVESDLNKSYYPKERKGRGHIVLTKDSTCGLIDEWQGSGSLLEIALEKDIRLPIRYIARVVYDGAVKYGIKEIYGVSDSLWSGAVKEIKPMKRRKGGFNE